VSTYIVTNNGGGLDRLRDHARQTVDSEDEARRAMIGMILADADYADEIGMHDLAEDLTAMAEDTNLARFGADGTIVTFGSFAYSAQKVPAMSETNATECECSEDCGPCEAHSEVLAQRAGACTRTADELLAVFIGDAEDIIGRPITEHDASAVADAYWRATGNAGGWVEHDGPDIGIGGKVIGTGAYGPAIRVCSDVIAAADLAEVLRDAAIYGAEGALPADVWVWWEDGYVISQITGGPLADDWDECVWCGRVARCSDAGTGDAMCEDCWHRMDWIIPDGPLLEEDGDR
jgi:hypothetical protein